MTQLDLIGPGTIFNPSNEGQVNFPSPFSLPGRETLSLTSSGATFVAANGVLAFVTLDTTGIAPGVHSLALSSPDLGPTDTGFTEPYLPTLIDGNITVVPEPASIVMGLMDAAALGAVVIRKRRARG